jgi:chaperonin GroES
MGFGSLLGPLNEATNTIINQLLDSGTINNLQAGFLSKGIKMTNGNTPLKPGEWRYVNTIGDDLRKGIVPIPSKEPSNVLFSLLSMMIQSGQQLSSVTDIMTGSSPGQNQPWSTTSEVLRQGLQVFSSIYKRIHRSMKREFKKIARLNSLYMEEKKYFAVLDPTDTSEVGMIGKSDFEDGDMDVVPNSDPTNISNAEKLAKAESLMQLLQLGAINPQVATKRILEASDQEGIDELMQLPEKQPSFEEQIKLQELQLAASSQEITKSKTQYQAMRDQAAAELTMTKAKSEEQRIGIEKMRLQYAIESKQTELAIAQQNETMQQQMAELERMQKQIDMVAKASGYELDYEERVSKLNDESIARQRQLEEDEKARTSSIVDPNQSVESEQTE